MPGGARYSTLGTIWENFHERRTVRPVPPASIRSPDSALEHLGGLSGRFPRSHVHSARCVAVPPRDVASPLPSAAADGDLRGSRAVPEATVARLATYLRVLSALGERDVTTVSSDELADAAGVNSAKLRKDLSFLGSYGIRGVGYDVGTLTEQIARTLGLTVHRSSPWSASATSARRWPATPGSPRAGSASRPWSMPTARVSAPRSAACVVRDVADLGRIVAEQQITIAVLAIPAAAAQQVCDQLVAAGVTSILNFAPVVLNGARRTSTCARSTWPPNCRSCPSMRHRKAQRC